MGKRGKRSPEQKLRILLEGLSGTIEISELCRREGIHPTLFYQWKKQMFAGANRLFAAEAGKPSAREAKLTMDLVRARHVIAEITAENLELKKTI